MRVFWSIPDLPYNYNSPIPIFSIQSNYCQYLDLFSQHGDKLIKGVSFFQYIIFSVIIIVVLENKKQKEIFINNDKSKN